MTETQLLVLDLGSKGYSCAQIILAGGLRLLGRTNPDLLRAMGGLAQGVGCSGNVCGAMTGGACLLALHTAKGKDDEETLLSSVPLMEAFVNWFSTNYSVQNSVTCDAILSGLNQQSHKNQRTMEPVHCGKIVASVLDKCLQMLVEQDIDPLSGRNEN